VRAKLLIILIGSVLLGVAPNATPSSIARNHAVASGGSFWQGKISSSYTAKKATSRPLYASVKRTALRPRSIRTVIIAQVTSKDSATFANSATPSPLLPIVDQPDIREREKIIADEVFRLMPPQCIAALKSFYVRYEPDAPRGLAGKENMIVKGGLPEEEFRALLVHEFGHVMDLGCFQGNVSSGETAFKDGGEMMYSDDPSIKFYEISWTASNVQKTGMKPEDFVTGYASWDVFEDFSESLAYYVFQRSAFIERAKTNAAIAEKLRWFETYVFQGGRTIAQGLHTWSGEVPWDSTKLPYNWITTH
jgi:hypothetical protein